MQLCCSQLVLDVRILTFDLVFPILYFYLAILIPRFGNLQSVLM